MSPYVLLAAAILAVAGEVAWLRPDVVIGWLQRHPRPLPAVYFLYFRIRRIEPDSSEGLAIYKISGLMAIFASGVILLQFAHLTLRWF